MNSIFDLMCNTIEKQLSDIYMHPFNQELGEGTLNQGTFNHYIEQDALYLAEFSKALALISTRLNVSSHARHFLQFALSAIEGERDLHKTYLSSNMNTPCTKQNPANFMYTNYLLKTACLGSVEEAVASVLPCFWIYQAVGKKLLLKTSPSHPYHTWISFYSGDEFSLSVSALVEITNQLGDSASPSTRTKMIDAFKQASRLEWLFWDDAYHQAQWKTPV